MKSFTCCLVTKNDQGEAVLNEDFVGTAISEHLVPSPDETSATGLKFTAMIGVLWEDHRAPSPSYHSPEELHWLGIDGIDYNSMDSLEEENEEDEEDEGIVTAEYDEEANFT